MTKPNPVSAPDAEAVLQVGRPRQTFLPFHLPHIGEEEIRAVEAILRSGWITTGGRVREFERAFADYIGVRHAIAVNSATAALHLALDAIGVGPGDEVLVPTMTFAASAEVVIYLGATPVLVDCQPDTLNLSTLDLERRITPRTKAIMPVHFAGHPCDMDVISDLAAANGLYVVDDAAHALPATFAGRRIGTISDLTCFSFYATKTITTGEGGMVTTDRDDFADRIRIMSLHGISRDAWKRYTAEGSWYYEILHPGYKYNLTDLAAALGVEQLKRCDVFSQRRSGIAERYRQGFEDVAQVTAPGCPADIGHSWHLYVIQLELDRLRIDRGAFIEALKALKIGTSVHFIPLHLHPYYREHWRYRPEHLPQATAAFERILSLPIYPDMTDDDVDDVINAVRGLCKAYAR